MPERYVDVVVGGGGVTGAAATWIPSAGYSNIRKIALLEKYARPGMVNSHPLNNAQTRHRGDTENNYSLPHALEIRDKSDLLGGYCLKKNDPELLQIRPRMAIAVTKEQVAQLEKRYRDFKPHYPDLELMYREQLKTFEPKIVKGRDPNAPLCALVSRNGHIVNFQKLAEHLLADAQELNPDLEVHFNTSIEDVRREPRGYVVDTNDGIRFHTKSIVFAAGAYSLSFAQKLGYGNKHSIFSIKGDFFDLGHQVNSKVYPMQKEGKPFAEFHVDPDILDTNMSRGGPTTLPVPLMESRRWETCPDYLRMFFRSPWATMKGFQSLKKILRADDRWAMKYVLRHGRYRLPIIGRWLVLSEIRPIIPTIRLRDVKLRKGAGGIRPQVIDLETGELIMGNVAIKGDREKGDDFIAVTTPSPGASASFGSGEEITEFLVERLGPSYWFDKERFRRDLLGYCRDSR